MSDRQERQKRIERFYLEQFINASGVEIVMEDEDREEPDFGVVYQEQPMGLEVTQLFKENFARGVPLQARESFWNRLLSETMETFFCKGGAPCNVKLLLSPSAVRKAKHDKSAVMGEIQSLLGEHGIPKPFEQVRLAGNASTPDVTSLYVTGITDEITPRWTCVNNNVGYVRTISNESILPHVQKKEKLLPRYRKSFEDNILFIFVESSRDSGMLDFQQGSAIESEFEKVFLYFHPNRWFELK